MLIVIANSTVEEDISWLDLSFAIFARQYRTVEFAEGHDLKDVGLIEMLRESMRLVVERYMILEAACCQITAVHLSGHEVLFPEVAAKLREKIEQLEKISRGFHWMAKSAATNGINLDEIRASIQPEVDQELSIWLTLAELKMLIQSGEGEACREPAERLLAIDREWRSPPESLKLCTTLSM